MIQVVIEIKLPNVWYCRGYTTKSSAIFVGVRKGLLKPVSLWCLVSLSHFESLVAATFSCLDFSRKMRDLNCRCSEVISRATGDAQACVSQLRALRCNGMPPTRAGFQGCRQRPPIAPGCQGHVSPASDHLPAVCDAPCLPNQGC